MNEKETAKKWYKQALHDLVIAEKNITIEGYDVAAFLSHQAVEKLLKAFYLFFKEKMCPELIILMNLPVCLIFQMMF